MSEHVALLRVLEFFADQVRSAQSDVPHGVTIRLEPGTELRDLRGASGAIRAFDREELSGKSRIAQLGELAAKELFFD